jgi:hypothetical protein
MIANDSLEEQRQLLYSSILRYTSEPITLRERVLDRVVLGALLGSSETDPFRVGRIVENLHLGKTSLKLRVETIQETLDRLIKTGNVRSIELVKRHAYYLTAEAQAAISGATNQIQQGFDMAVQRMLKNIAHLVEIEIAASVCRRFIFECFARFGQIMAKTVTGHIKPDELPRILDSRNAFRSSIEGYTLSAPAIQSLKARCDKFLKSTDPDDQKVKFNLSQGYYLTQLLGFEDSGFNPLRDHAFSDSVFYLDTNVVLIGVVYVAEHSGLFDEMVRVTKRMNVTLCVTRATVNEARRVARDRFTQIKKIIEVLPEQLIERTDDQFILAYLHARTKDPTITPEKFVAPFDSLADLLKERWNIEIDDRVEEDIFGNKDVSKICRIIDEEAEQVRGWGKSDPVRRHDACHYLLIAEARISNSKTWFLTRDRTLVAAAYKLEPGADVLFCFSLIGFLHSISPFIVTTTEEDTIVNALSAFMSEQVFAIGPVFDAAELALMAEFHDDVMSTSADQLLLALDYIKTKTLEGKPYRTDDIPKVSLELRKFLSSSKDEQYRVLEIERMRLESLAQDEERRRLSAEERAASLEQTGQAQRTQLSETQLEIEAGRKDAHRQRLNFRGLLMALGITAGFALWLNSHGITIWLTTTYPKISDLVSLTTFEAIVSGIGAIVFAWPTFSFVLATSIRHQLKSAILVIVAAIVIVLSKLFSEATLSVWANAIGVITPLVLLILAMRPRENRTN